MRFLVVHSDTGRGGAPLSGVREVGIPAAGSEGFGWCRRRGWRAAQKHNPTVVGGSGSHFSKSARSGAPRFVSLSAESQPHAIPEIGATRLRKKSSVREKRTSGAKAPTYFQRLSGTSKLVPFPILLTWCLFPPPVTRTLVSRSLCSVQRGACRATSVTAEDCLWGVDWVTGSLVCRP